MAKRIRFHRWELRHGRHKNAHLQAAWVRYGEQSFTFTVLQDMEGVTVDELRTGEANWMQRLRATERGYGYNIEAQTANGARLTSEETKAKLRAAMLGRKMPPEFGRRISSSKKGNVVISDEQRRQISARLTGCKQSQETIARRVAALRGQKRGPEVGAKISAAKRGKPFSAAHRAALSAARCRVLKELRSAGQEGELG